MKRRLLLVESNSVDQQWMVSQLNSRFRAALTVTCVTSLDEAHRAIVDYGCDIIVTALKLTDGESPAAITHALMAFAPRVPIIALTELAPDDELLLDVITIGIRHILYKEDLQKDYSRMVSAIMDTVRELVTRDSSANNFSDRVQALSQKIWDVDNRMQTTETLLQALTASIEKLIDVIEKRGGLEDRVEDLEKVNAIAVRVAVGATGVIGTLLTGVAAIIGFFYKK